MDDALVVDNASFCYGSRVVVEGLSLALRRGEVLGIVGPNGAGKSTLLRGLCGLLPPSRGRIMLRDRSTPVLRAVAHAKPSELARRIAMVPQHPNLPAAFTAGEIVLFGRTPHLGWFQTEGPRDWIAIRRAMLLTDCLHLADRPVDELSGGERQRVVIARALAQEPDILLLDEPTAHLDLSHQVDVLDLVQRLRGESDIAVVAVFHDLNLAAQYCQRLIMLADGRVQAEGTPATVITAANIARVYGARVCILPHPINGLPITVALPAVPLPRPTREALV